MKIALRNIGLVRPLGLCLVLLQSCFGHPASSKLDQVPVSGLPLVKAVDPAAKVGLLAIGPDAVAPFFVTAGKYYKINCANTQPDFLQNQVVGGLGIKAELVKFIRPTKFNNSDGLDLVTLDCRGSSNFTYYKTHDVTRNADIYWIFDRTPQKKRAYILGCAALEKAFGVSAQDREDDDQPADLRSLTPDKIYPVNCYRGYEINPSANGFAGATAIAAKNRGRINGGESFVVPLELQTSDRTEVPMFQVIPDPAKPCKPALVWTKFAGLHGENLIIGTRATVSNYSCNVLVTGTVGARVSQSLVVAIEAKGKSYDHVWSLGSTTCVSSLSGDVNCLGTSNFALPQRASRVKDLVIGLNYLCAIYDEASDNNIACTYSSSVPDSIKVKQPAGHARAIAGNFDYVCVSLDAVNDPASKDQDLKCWITNVNQANNNAILPSALSLKDNKFLSSSIDSGLCYDEYLSDTSKRVINCFNDAGFDELQLSPAPQPGQPTSRPNIKDLNAQSGVDATDLKRGSRFGCVGMNKSIECWGIPDDLLTEMKKIALKPGSLRLDEETICFQEDPGGGTTVGKVNCWNLAATKQTESPTSLKDYAIARTGTVRSACVIDAMGLGLKCGAKVYSLKDLSPDAIYWEKQL